MDNNQPIDPALEKLAEGVQKDKETMDKQIDQAYEEAVKNNPEYAEIDKDDLPQRTMFHAITDAIINIMKDPAVNQIFISLRDKLSVLGGAEKSVDISMEIAQLISTSTTYAIFAGLGYYDGSLKTELEENFLMIHEVINRIDSDLEVAKMKIGDLERSQGLTGVTVTEKQ